MSARPKTRKKTAKVTPERTAKRAQKKAPTKRTAEIGFSYGGILRKRPPPTATQLAVIERRVGTRVPDDYKAFLATQNGGAPDKNFLPIKKDGFLVECFYYVDGKKKDIYDVEKASEWPSESLGEQVVAIATDGSGDQLVLRRKKGGWEVAWWRHDQVPALVPVAASFGDLLGKLVSDPLAAESFD